MGRCEIWQVCFRDRNMFKRSECLSGFTCGKGEERDDGMDVWMGDKRRERITCRVDWEFARKRDIQRPQKSWNPERLEYSSDPEDRMNPCILISYLIRVQHQNLDISLSLLFQRFNGLGRSNTGNHNISPFLQIQHQRLSQRRVGTQNN